MYNSKIKQENGITLVALVITIVIIMILSIIAINTIFGENGLVRSAEKAKFESDKATAREQIELVLGSAYIEKSTKKPGYNDNEYLDNYVKERLPGVEIGEKEIALNGFVFELDRSVPRLGKYIGQSTGPVIKEIKVVEKTTNSIIIEVEAIRAEGGDYTYTYKKNDEGEESWKQAGSGKDNTCTFDNLEANVIYNIKVKVVTKEGEAEGEENVTTGELPTGKITFGEIVWNRGTAKVTINTSEEGYRLQYQIKDDEDNILNEKDWKDTTSGSEITDLIHGQTVYGRLYDGLNGTEPASLSIIDKLEPIVTVTEGRTNTNSVTVSVQAVDNESGMIANPTYTYYIKKSAEGEEKYQEKATDIIETSYTFEGLIQETSYDIKVEVKGDKAGNVGTGLLTGQKTTKVPGGETGIEQGAITFENTIWSNNKASVTVSTNTEYKIQYQVGAITEGQWTEISNGGTISNLQHGQIVYARLYDGTNYGDEASVTIKDTVNPTVPTIRVSGTSGTNGWYKGTVTATIDAGTDGQSGVKKVRYKVTGAQTIEQTDTNDGVTSTSITISADGTSTITAYTIDKAGNVSEEKTQVVNKDSTAPSVTLSAGTKTENSITLNVNASDATSGLITSGTYKYYLNSESNPRNTSSTNSYTYTGLTAGTSYTLKVVVTDKAGNIATKTTSVSTTAKTVQSTLKAGDYVTYPSSQGDLECRVLYDSSSGYGVQLITRECPKDITLGSSNFDESKMSYNNAVGTLNTEAGMYNNSTYSTRARCVGSHPTSISDTTSYYTRSESWFTSQYNNQFLNEDTNYELDYNQMKELGILSINVNYWLASRYVRPDPSYSAFYVRNVYTSGGLFSNYMCHVTSGSTSARSAPYGLRPVFILKPSIKVTGGNGTSGSPYTLGV